MNNLKEIKRKGINYVLSGKGQLIVLIHGWGQSINMWSDLIDQLSTKHTVFALDLPGFGKSDVPSKEFAIEDYSNKINMLLKELNFGTNYTVIAHSFGARIGIDLRNKFKIKKLILIGSYPLSMRFQSMILKICFSLFPLPFQYFSMHTFHPKTYSNTSKYSFERARFLLKTFYLTHQNNYELLDIDGNKDVIIIHGERDFLASPTKIKKYAKKFDIKINMIRNAGHFPHIQNPQATNGVLDNLLINSDT